MSLTRPLIGAALVLAATAICATVELIGSTGAAGSTGSSASTAPAAGSATTGTGTTTTTSKGKGKHHGAAAKSVKGSVASVDDKSFVVHPKKGDDVTVKVNDKTAYPPKGKGWDDVKAGAKAGADVTVKYHNDGTDNWALSVTFTHRTCPVGNHPCGNDCCPN
jgi:hypothetical protein